MNFIGQSAPQWTRKGSNSDQESTFSSQMLLGKWYVVYWYPKDFSSVCPTEVRAIEQYFESFSDEGVAIFGCSLDSIETHQRWICSKEIFPQGLQHVLLSDEDGEMTDTFHMRHEASGLPCRGLIIVDDMGIIQHYSQSSLAVGRQPQSILRMVEALKSGGLCSATWVKGDKHIGED